MHKLKQWKIGGLPYSAVVRQSKPRVTKPKIYEPCYRKFKVPGGRAIYGSR